MRQGRLFAEPMRVRGLAFQEPWASAIVRAVPVGATAPYPKDIDNRSVGPGSMVGGLLAIRTTKTVDLAGLRWLRETYNYPWAECDLFAPSLIVGVARVDAAVFSGERPWYFGQVHNGKSNVGWVLRDLAVIDPPIAFTPKCGLGLWTVPDELAETLRGHYERGRR